MKRRSVKIVASVLLVGVILCGALFGAIVWNIRQSVQENCRIAQEAYPHPGDDVAALVDFMNSPEHSLHDRNHKAIWTLGRLRDPKALPALQSVYTGDSCDHEKNVCQYELEKAIKQCGGTPDPPRQTKH
ncbi:hypothetical protein ACFLSJ_04715 [Verrucomicrobiota bacterium]